MRSWRTRPSRAPKTRQRRSPRLARDAARPDAALLLAVGGVQSRFDCAKQGPQAERDVLDPAVDEERRGAANATVDAALQVLAHALQVDVIVHLRGEARHVEAEPLRVAVKVLRFQVRLIGEQQVVHRPELPLAASALRGLGRGQRVRMRLFEGEIAKGEPHPAVKPLEQQFERRLRLLAVRALEIPILDHGHRGVSRAGQVIDGADGDGELEGPVPVHSIPQPCAGAGPPGWNRLAATTPSAMNPASTSAWVTAKGGSDPVGANALRNGSFWNACTTATNTFR